MLPLRSTLRMFLFGLVFLGLVAHICELPLLALAAEGAAHAKAEEGSGHQDAAVHDASCEAIRPVSTIPPLPVVQPRLSVLAAWVPFLPTIPSASPVLPTGSPPLYLVHAALLI
jgi:hypothetical protein